MLNVHRKNRRFRRDITEGGEASVTVGHYSLDSNLAGYLLCVLLSLLTSLCAWLLLKNV